MDSKIFIFDNLKELSVQFLRNQPLNYLRHYQNLLQIHNLKDKNKNSHNNFYPMNMPQNSERIEDLVIYFYKDQENLVINNFSFKNSLSKTPSLWEDFLKISLQKFYFFIFLEKSRFLNYYQEFSFFAILEKNKVLRNFKSMSTSYQNVVSTKTNFKNFSGLTLTSKSYMKQFFSLSKKGIEVNIPTKKRSLKEEALAFYRVELFTHFKKVRLNFTYGDLFSQKLKQMMKFKNFTSPLLDFPLCFPSSLSSSGMSSNEKPSPKKLDEVLIKQTYLELLESCFIENFHEFKTLFNRRLFFSFSNLKLRFKPMNFLRSWEFPLLIKEIKGFYLFPNEEVSAYRMSVPSKNSLFHNWRDKNFHNLSETASKPLTPYGLFDKLKPKQSPLLLREFYNFVDSIVFEDLKTEKTIFHEFLRFDCLHRFDFSQKKSFDSLQCQIDLNANFQSLAFYNLAFTKFPFVLMGNSCFEFIWFPFSSTLDFQKFFEYLKSLGVIPNNSTFNISVYSKGNRILNPQIKPLLPHFQKMQMSSSKNDWPFFKLGNLKQISRFENDYEIHFSKNLEMKPFELWTSNYFKDLKVMIKKSGSQSQLELIKRLNPKIYIWSYRYRFLVFNPQIYFNLMDKKLFELLWRWACRRHGNKSKRWIREKYFYKFENQGWIFGTYETGARTTEFSEFIYVPFHRQIFENFRSCLVRKEKDCFF